MPTDQPVYLHDIWPSAKEISDTVADAVRADMFEKNYANVFEGDERWKAIKVPDEDRYTWPDSTYVRRPPFFEGMDPEPAAARASRSRTPGCWPSSAIRSPPTTSRPPGRSRSRARPASG